MFYASYENKSPQKCKLPLKICKGSVKSRLELARQYNNEFFYSICNKFENNLIDKDIFSQNLSSINNKIKFNLKDSNSFDSCLGCVEAVFDKKNKNKIVSYDIYIPISQDNKICLEDADTFMHETFHYFFSIVNPKHLSRIIEMSKNKLAEKLKNFMMDIYLHVLVIIQDIQKESCATIWNISQQINK